MTQNSSTVNPQDKVRIANCLTYLVPVKIIIFSALAVLYIPVAYMRSPIISYTIIILNFQIDYSKLYFSMHLSVASNYVEKPRSEFPSTGIGLKSSACNKLLKSINLSSLKTFQYPFLSFQNSTVHSVES